MLGASAQREDSVRAAAPSRGVVGGLAGGRAGEQAGALASVAGELGGALELAAGLRAAAQALEQIGAGAGQQVIAGEAGFAAKPVQQREAGPGALGARHGHGAV